MEFQPLLGQPLLTMDKRIFAEGPMGIRDEILGTASQKKTDVL